MALQVVASDVMRVTLLDSSISMHSCGWHTNLRLINLAPESVVAKRERAILCNTSEPRGGHSCRVPSFQSERKPKKARQTVHSKRDPNDVCLPKSDDDYAMIARQFSSCSCLLPSLCLQES